jgi:hypothetical protein
VNVLWALLALLLSLGFQAALGRIWPEAHRLVDALLVPVALYGISGSPRSAMFVGCAAGLLQDTWFQVGTFGLNGFKRTLLGWALGGVAGRLDLGHTGGRLITGALLSIGDNLLDLVLRRLLDLQPASRSLWEWAVEAVLTGLLVALVGSMVDRRRQAQPVRRFV